MEARGQGRAALRRTPSPDSRQGEQSARPRLNALMSRKQNWRKRFPHAKGRALALDPHLYPENQKGRKTLVNQ